MLPLPIEIIPVLQPFAPAFRRRVWELAQVLLVGAILAPGRRTVAAALRMVHIPRALFERVTETLAFAA